MCTCTRAWSCESAHVARVARVTKQVYRPCGRPPTRTSGCVKGPYGHPPTPTPAGVPGTGPAGTRLWLEEGRRGGGRKEGGGGGGEEGSPATRGTRHRPCGHHSVLRPRPSLARSLARSLPFSLPHFSLSLLSSLPPSLRLSPSEGGTRESGGDDEDCGGSVCPRMDSDGRLEWATRMGDSDRRLR
jgi:hypothetical protein